EAEELLRHPSGSQIGASLWGSQAERVRWIRHNVWNRLPPVLRPAGYFVYRYLLRMGFLDGREALISQLLQAFWFPLLIDTYYLEMKRSDEARGAPQASAPSNAASRRST